MSYEIESVVYTAFPTFTNLFKVHGYINKPVYGNLLIHSKVDNIFTLYGRRLGDNNTFYLSSPKEGFWENYEEIRTEKFPVISAYRIPSEYVKVLNKNVVTITIPANSLSINGEFKFVTANKAGWGTWKDDRTFTNRVSGVYGTFLQPGGVFTFLQPGGIGKFLYRVQ